LYFSAKLRAPLSEKVDSGSSVKASLPHTYRHRLKDMRAFNLDAHGDKSAIRVAQKLKLPKRQRNPTISAEVADLIELAAHQTVGAVGGDYWVHSPSLTPLQRQRLKLSATRVGSCR
jgi:hypothetical protein